MDDKNLMDLLRKKPNQGMKMCIDQYAAPVSTICRNFLYDCSEEDVEETIAETFVKFWKVSKNFELNETYSLKSYIYTIARNVAIDKRRKLRRESIFSIEEVVLEIPSDFSVEKQIEQKEIETILHECLADMKEPDKSIFLYRYFYGYKIKEIAELLDLSIKKVENILYRGKEKLRKDLLERGI